MSLYESRAKKRVSKFSLAQTWQVLTYERYVQLYTLYLMFELFKKLSGDLCCSHNNIYLMLLATKSYMDFEFELCILPGFGFGIVFIARPLVPL